MPDAIARWPALRIILCSAALVVALLLGLDAGAGRAQSPNVVTFPAASSGQISFVTPSRNIGCTYTPAGGTPVYKPFDGGPELSCDRVKPKYVRLVLTPKMVHRFDDVGDQDCCGVENVFAYGARWSQGPFSCDSAESGLTCKLPDGRGFSMSMAAVKVF
jgi:hypothetical protein